MLTFCPATINAPQLSPFVSGGPPDGVPRTAEDQLAGSSRRPATRATTHHQHRRDGIHRHLRYAISRPCHFLSARVDNISGASISSTASIPLPKHTEHHSRAPSRAHALWDGVWYMRDDTYTSLATPTCMCRTVKHTAGTEHTGPSGHPSACRPR